MAYNWNTHIAAYRQHVLAGDWEWEPDTLDFQPPRPRRIMLAVCKVWQMPLPQFLGDRNHKRFVLARHSAMLLMRERLRMSYPAIARIFKMDHSSIIYGCKRQRDRISNSEQIAERHRQAGDILGEGFGS